MKKLFLLLFLIPNLVMAASFDCAKASTKHEKMICDNPELNKADEEIGNLYFFALKTFKEDAKEIKIAQKEFNKKYRKCKVLEKCLSVIKQRIGELNLRLDDEYVNYLKSLSPKTISPDRILFDVECKENKDDDGNVKYREILLKVENNTRTEINQYIQNSGLGRDKYRKTPYYSWTLHGPYTIVAIQTSNEEFFFYDPKPIVARWNEVVPEDLIKEIAINGEYNIYLGYGELSKNEEVFYGNAKIKNSRTIRDCFKINEDE